MAYRNKRRPQRGWHAGQKASGFMRLIGHVQRGIEPGQAQHAANRKGQRGKPAKARRALQAPQKQDKRRRHAKTHRIRQAVQLRAKARLRLQQASDAAIHPIQHASQNDRRHRFLPIIHRQRVGKSIGMAGNCPAAGRGNGKADARKARCQRRRRNGIGHQRPQRQPPGQVGGQPGRNTRRNKWRQTALCAAPPPLARRAH